MSERLEIGPLRWRLRMIVAYKVVLPILILRKRLCEILRRSAVPEILGVNIGGGHFLRWRWRTLDRISPQYPYSTSYVDYDFDLTTSDPLPLESESVRFLYSAHTLEHIPQEHCQHIMSEIYRILAPGGAVRFTMPDFDKYYDAYRHRNYAFFGMGSRDNEGSDSIEHSFLNTFASAVCGEVSVQDIRRNFDTLSREAFADHYTGLASRERQAENPGFHVNWWNYDKLERILTKAVFKQVYRSAPQQSRFPELRGTEWFFGIGKGGCLDVFTGIDTTNSDISVYAEAVK